MKKSSLTIPLALSIVGAVCIPAYAAGPLTYTGLVTEYFPNNSGAREFNVEFETPDDDIVMPPNDRIETHVYYLVEGVAVTYQGSARSMAAGIEERDARGEEQVRARYFSQWQDMDGNWWHMDMGRAPIGGQSVLKRFSGQFDDANGWSLTTAGSQSEYFFNTEKMVKLIAAYVLTGDGGKSTANQDCTNQYDSQVGSTRFTNAKWIGFETGTESPWVQSGPIDSGDNPPVRTCNAYDFDPGMYDMENGRDGEFKLY
jgi:hypothetical protein